MIIEHNHCLLMEGAREYLEIPMRHTTAHNHDAQANIDQHSPEKSSAIMIHQRLGNDASRTTLTVKRNPVNEYAAQRRDAVPMSEHMVLSSGADKKYDTSSSLSECPCSEECVDESV